MSGNGVALLGVGRMGTAFVERWSAAGREVTVWNRTASAAEQLRSDLVRPAESIVDAVADAGVVVTMLIDGPALRSVLIDHGGLDAISPTAVLVDLSTVDVESSAAIAEAAATHGVGYVRGAVSGTPAVVRAGNAALLLSGPAEAIEAAEPVLSEIAPAHAVVGEADEARVVKLAINAMLAGTTELLAEATVLAEASGIERGVFLDALSASVLASPFLGYKGAALRAANYAATFTTDGLVKDVRLALAQADAVGVPAPAVGVALERLLAARDAGYGDDDFLSLFRVQQSAAGRPVD